MHAKQISEPIKTLYSELSFEGEHVWSNLIRYQKISGYVIKIIEQYWAQLNICNCFKCPNTTDNIYAKYRTSFKGCPRSCPTMTNMYIYLYMARYHFLAHAHYTIVIKFGFLGMAICMYNLCMLQSETTFMDIHVVCYYGPFLL